MLLESNEGSHILYSDALIVFLSWIAYASLCVSMIFVIVRGARDTLDLKHRFAIYGSVSFVIVHNVCNF